MQILVNNGGIIVEGNRQVAILNYWEKRSRISGLEVTRLKGGLAIMIASGLYGHVFF